MNGESINGQPASKTDAELLADIRDRMLGRFKSRFPDLPDVLEGGICAALVAIEQSRLTTLMDEESITSTLLGALVTGSSISAAAFAPSADEPVSGSLNWAGYHKSNSSDDWGAESKNGADFALVIWHTKQTARLAVFQAKRAETKLPAEVTRRNSNSTFSPKFERIFFARKETFLDVHRRPPRRGQLLEQWRKAQMEKLFEMGRDVQRAGILLGMGQLSKDVRSILSDYRAPFPPVPALLKKEREDLLKLSEKDREKARKKKEASLRDLDLEKYDLEVKSVEKQHIEAGNKLKAFFSKQVDDPSLELRAMTWIHYLAYLSKPPSSTLADSVGEDQGTLDAKSESAVAIPLADLGPWRRKEMQPDAAAKNYIDLSDVACRAFSDLLLSGAASTKEPVDGWLDVDRVVVDTMLPRLQELGPVVFLRTREAMQPIPTPGPSLAAEVFVANHDKPKSSATDHTSEVLQVADQSKNAVQERKERVPVPKPESAGMDTPEAKDELKAEDEPELKAEDEPELKAKDEPELKAEDEPELKAEDEPEPKAEDEPKAVAPPRRRRRMPWDPPGPDWVG